MQSSGQIRGVIHFGPFEADLEEGVLRKHGTKIRLQTQPFQILAALLETPGKVITRDELRRCLWPKDTFVDFEHGLNAAVARLRQALGDSAEQPRYIETLAKRGYRFTAKVAGPVIEKGEELPASPVAAKHKAAPWIAAAVLLGAGGALVFVVISHPAVAQGTAPSTFDDISRNGITPGAVARWESCSLRLERGETGQLRYLCDVHPLRCPNASDERSGRRYEPGLVSRRSHHRVLA